MVSRREALFFLVDFSTFEKVKRFSGFGWIAWVWLSLAAGVVQAQIPFYRQINESSGLPDNEIYDLYQDRQGFIWIAGNGGLLRYDGQSFKAYRGSKQISRSLSNLSEDAWGRIWVGDFTGRVFCVQGDSLATVALANPDLKHGFLVPLAHDSTLLVQGQDFLQTYRLKSPQKKVRPRLLFQKTGFRLNQKAQASADTFWLATHPPRYIVRDSILQSLDIEVPQGIDVGNQNIAIQGSEFFLTQSEAVVYRRLGKQFQYLGPLDRFSTLYKLHYQDSILWACTRRGVYGYRWKDQTFQKAFHWFPDAEVSSIMRDREGNYWVSTLNRGIFRIGNTEIRDELIGQSLYPDVRNVLTLDTASLLVAMGDGRLLFFHQDQQIQHILPIRTRRPYLTVSFSLDKKNIWLAGDSLGLLDIKTRKVRWLFQNFGVRQIWEESGDIHLMATNRGLTLCGKTKSQIFSWLADHNLAPPNLGWIEFSHWPMKVVLDRPTRHFFISPCDQKLLAGTNEGLGFFRGKEFFFYEYRGERVFSYCHQIQGDSVWVGTLNQGVFVYRQGRLRKATELDSRIDDRFIRSLNLQGENLWFTTNRTIYCWQPRLKKLRAYDREDGLPDAQVVTLALTRDRVFWGTSQGLYSFPQRLDPERTYPPDIYLRGLFYGGQSRSDTHSIELDYDTRDLALDFGTRYFSGYQRPTIYWRFIRQGELIAYSPLKGTQLSLPNLGNGDYTVEAIAKTPQGISSKPLRISFSVVPPFWLRWWFIFSAAFLVVLSIFAAFTYRLTVIEDRTRLANQAERLERELKASQLASIKARMNPHFLFNALATIQNYIYKNERDNASYFLGRFSVLMRRILEQSNAENLSLHEEIESLRLYLELEKMRFGEALRFDIEVEEDLEPEEVYIPALIIQPFVENAIKHGLLHKKGERWVGLRFRRVQTGVLQVVIEDNGIGRKAALELKQRRKDFSHSSYSSEANRHRLELLNENRASGQIALTIEDLADESGLAVGTRVTLHIPFEA